jgi:hypothetical protein
MRMNTGAAAVAATAYLAAANPYKKAINALAAKYKTFGTLARARAYYKAAAALEGRFVASMKLITVPADTTGDFHTLIIRITALQALDIEGSGVKSWAAVSSLQSDLLKAERAAAAVANLIRSDLGLPPVPA